ncbi:unnamed protein product, partial [Ascophyllum nodosum]
MIEELFDKSDRELDELTEMRATKQLLAGLEQEARQPRLAMEDDVPSNIKTRKCTGRAPLQQIRSSMDGDSCSAKRVQAGTSSTSFGMKAEPPALPRRDNIL